MKKRIMLLFCLGFFLTGCAASYNIPASDVAVPIAPIVAKKLPLKIGVVLLPENFTLTKTMPELAGQSTLTIPFGKMVKQSSLNIVPKFFESVEIVAGEEIGKGEPYPPGLQALFIMIVDDFYKEPEENNKASTAFVSLKSQLTDMEGKPLWSKTIRVKEELDMPSVFTSEAVANFWGGLFARATASAVKETCEAIFSSKEIQALAYGKSETAVAAVAAPKEIAPVVKSDIDDLPSMKVKANKNAYALVVGIENYRQKLPKADFASQDARLVAEYLTKAMGYPEENVVTLINDRAAKSDFEKYFEKWLGNNVEKDGTVFIYFSGHGAPDPKTGSAFLVPYDGDPSFIAETGYSLKRMYAALEKLPAKKIVVALDSCFSGAGGRSVLAKGARPLVMNLQTDMAVSQNMTVLSASSGEQISSTYDEKGHGLFTYFLLKGIKNEDVVNPDGSLKVDDLFSYVKPQVERIARKQYNNEQTPQKIVGKTN